MFRRSCFLIVIVLVCVFSRSGYGQPWVGSGDANDPYQIWTAEEMQAIGADPNYWGAHFLLCADIDLGAYTGTSFNIIGNDVNAFTGVFDGDGHVISNFIYYYGVSYTGFFGYIDDPNAEIKNLGLVDPNIKAVGKWYIGSLAGYLENGTISNCYAESGSISGRDSVGGLVGKNYGYIQGCYSTSAVMGNEDVGGLAGANFGDIESSYSRGEIAGEAFVGGLVGDNGGDINESYSTGIVTGELAVGGLVGGNPGEIQGSYSTGIVTGKRAVGGLAGHNLFGKIERSHSTGTVTGEEDSAGGLVGYNGGEIKSCYSTGSVTAELLVGGLVGFNDGYIFNSYTTGSVAGRVTVGGLVGLDWWGNIQSSYSAGAVTGESNVGGLIGSESLRTDYTACFWDSDVNPDVNGIGDGNDPNVIGLPTVLMQTESTFVDAGWDFVGEVINGTEDIWQMCYLPDYPKLAWEICPVELEMEVTPAMLNCASGGNWVEAHFVLPEGYLPGDIDINTPAVAEPVGAVSEAIEIIDEGDGYYRIVAVFDREAFCEAIGEGIEKELEVTVIGSFTDGLRFYGTDTISLISDHWRHREAYSGEK